MSPFTQSSIKITYFPHNLFKFSVLNFPSDIKLSSDFYQVQISTYYEKIISSNALSFQVLLLEGVPFFPS